MGRPREDGPSETRRLSRSRRTDVLLLPILGSPRGECLLGERRAVACLHSLPCTKLAEH